MTRRNYATERNVTPPPVEHEQRMGRVLEVLTKSFKLSEVKARLDKIDAEENARLERRLANLRPPMDLGEES